jgi:hypothetical protein
VAHLSPKEYDRLERAVQDGTRIALVRQGRELVVTPRRLFVRDGRDVIEARHPTTGDIFDVIIETLDALEVLP